MATSCCPTCGRKLATAKKSAVQLPERAELDGRYAARQMSKAEYFDACKAIGLRDDLRFFIRVASWRMTPDVLVDAMGLAAELEHRKSTRADAVAINRLRDRYRMTLPSLTLVRADVAEAA